MFAGKLRACTEQFEHDRVLGQPVTNRITVNVTC
jgi:hypothetical protein